MSSVKQHVEAELHFLKTEEGGRRSPTCTGYRGQFYYDGRDWDSVHTYPDVEQVRPGETVRVLLWFTNPKAHAGKLYPGKEFEVREGAHIVGRGRITRLLELGTD